MSVSSVINYNNNNSNNYINNNMYSCRILDDLKMGTENYRNLKDIEQTDIEDQTL